VPLIVGDGRTRLRPLARPRLDLPKDSLTGDGEILACAVNLLKRARSPCPIGRRKSWMKNTGASHRTCHPYSSGKLLALM
jgi:hypothetical protein